MSSNTTGNTLEGVTKVVADGHGGFQEQSVFGNGYDPRSDGHGEPEVRERSDAGGVAKVVGGRTTISDVIRVTAEYFKTPCGGILSTAATTHDAPTCVLTPKTLVDHCNTQIELATAEQLGLVRRDSQGNYIEVPLRG